MSSRNPDQSAGVYAAIISAVTLFCLLGALALPPSITLNRWIGLAALAGLFLFLPFLGRLAHKSRIREAVGERGGRVLRVKRLPFWQQPLDAFYWGVRYQVDYVDLVAGLHRAVCRSSFFIGVRWVTDVVVPASPE
jgi:hypothetical protein